MKKILSLFILLFVIASCGKADEVPIDVDNTTSTTSWETNDANTTNSEKQVSNNSWDNSFDWLYASYVDRSLNATETLLNKVSDVDLDMALDIPWIANANFSWNIKRNSDLTNQNWSLDLSNLKASIDYMGIQWSIEAKSMSMIYSLTDYFFRFDDININSSDLDDMDIDANNKLTPYNQKWIHMDTSSSYNAQDLDMQKEVIDLFEDIKQAISKTPILKAVDEWSSSGTKITYKIKENKTNIALLVAKLSQDSSKNLSLSEIADSIDSLRDVNIDGTITFDTTNQDYLEMDLTHSDKDWIVSWNISFKRDVDMLEFSLNGPDGENILNLNYNKQGFNLNVDRDDLFKLNINSTLDDDKIKSLNFNLDSDLFNLSLNLTQDRDGVSWPIKAISMWEEVFSAQVYLELDIKKWYTLDIDNIVVSADMPVSAGTKLHLSVKNNEVSGIQNINMPTDYIEYDDVVEALGRF